MTSSTTQVILALTCLVPCGWALLCCHLWLFHLLSLGVLRFFHLCANMASSTQWWRQMIYLHPGISCPLGYVLPVQYCFTWLICISLQPSSANPVYTASSFQFNCHFLPSHKHYYVLSVVPPKTPYPTPAAGLPHPIFNFPLEIMHFLPPLLHPRCLPALLHPLFQPAPAL